MDDLLLQKYLRNETSEEELVEVLDWLDASTENQRYLDRLDYISNLNILAGEAQPRIRRRTVSLWKRAAQWSAAAAAVLTVMQLILGGGVGALVYILGPLAAWLMLRRSWSLLR